MMAFVGSSSRQTKASNQRGWIRLSTMSLRRNTGRHWMLLRPMQSNVALGAASQAANAGGVGVVSEAAGESAAASAPARAE